MDTLPVAIPTLSQWGMIMVSALLIISGALLYLRRNRKDSQGQDPDGP